METIFTNAMVVTADDMFDGTVVIDRGSITAVDTGTCQTRGAKDCEGDFLIPGLIDLHTDNLEKHFQPRQDVTWDEVGAAIAHDGQIAAAGITTVFDSLSVYGVKGGFDRMKNLTPMVGGLEAAKEQNLLRIDHKVHLRCELSSPELGESLEKHLGNSLIGLLSMMDHSPGQRQYRHLKDDEIDEWLAKFGKSENEIQKIKASMLSGRDADYVRVNRAAVVEAAQQIGVPLASHDDETPEHIAQAVADGASIAEFPVTLEASRLSKEKGLKVVMGAPNLVRGGSHSGNVSVADVLQADAGDALASDYLPLSMLRGAFMLTEPPFHWPVPKAISTVTSAPASAARLPDRGEIRVEKRADLVRVRRAKNGWPKVCETWSGGLRAA